jgi:hypothetical protein
MGLDLRQRHGVGLDNLILSGKMAPWLENLVFIILARYTMPSFGVMPGRIFFSKTRIVTDFIGFWMKANKSMATVSMHSV